MERHREEEVPKRNSSIRPTAPKFEISKKVVETKGGIVERIRRVAHIFDAANEDERMAG